MTVPEISQLILSLSLAFAIIGISFQLMRLLGTTNDAAQDLRHLVYQVSDLVAEVAGEVGHIKNVIGEVGSAISKIKTGILDPVVRFTTVIGSFIDSATSRMTK